MARTLPTVLPRWPDYRWFFFAQFADAVTFWQSQHKTTPPTADERQALAETTLLPAFDKHFATIQLSGIFAIPYKAVRSLIYDEAMNALLADSVKSAYLRRLGNLRAAAKK